MLTCSSSVVSAERWSRRTAATPARDVEEHSDPIGAVPREDVVGMTRRQVKVVIRHDPNPKTAWLANVAGVHGAHTFGRSMTEAKRHAVEVVAHPGGISRRAWDSNPR